MGARAHDVGQARVMDALRAFRPGRRSACAPAALGSDARAERGPRDPGPKRSVDTNEDGGPARQAPAPQA